MSRARAFPALVMAGLVLTTLAGGAVPRALAGPGIPCTPAASGRAAAARAVNGGFSVIGPPPDTSGFVLFGWVSPPAESTTAARIDEMAGIGFNLLLPAWLDKGCPDDNLARLDWAAARGMRCLIWDSRLMGAFRWLPTFEDTLNEVVAEYRDHPGLWGYYLGDEPPTDLWPLLARIRQTLRERDPTHPGWNSLLGRGSYGTDEAFRAELRDYAATVRPPVLSDNYYPFHQTFDDGHFIENLAGLGDVSEELGLPFWNIVQLIPHFTYRPLTHGELRWQVSQSLAYGARGIGYFTYWTPDPDPDPTVNWQPAIIDNQGHRTAWYDFLAGFDPGVRLAGDALAAARRRRTTHAGSLPSGGIAFTADAWLAAADGRAALGEFEGPAGQRLVLVANSDSLAARTIALTTTASGGARLIAGGSSPQLSVETRATGARLVLALEAGDFALLALDPDGPRASVSVAPNPGIDAVKLGVRSSAGATRIEILDMGGRRIWSAAFDPAIPTYVWRGERTDGRRARPGIYLARILDGTETRAARRFTWLGTR